MAEWRTGMVAVVSADGNRFGGGRFVVTKVGRRWLTVIDGRRARQFDLATGQENSDGCGGYCYARTEEEHAAWEARCAASERLRKATAGHSWGANLTVYEAHQVADIIESANARGAARG